MDLQRAEDLLLRRLEVALWWVLSYRVLWLHLVYYTGLATFLWAIINAELQHTPLEAVQSTHTCLQWETKKPQISSRLAPSSSTQLGPCHSKTEVDIKSFSIVGETVIRKPTSLVVKALEGCGTGKFGDCFFLDCLQMCHLHFLPSPAIILAVVAGMGTLATF